MNEMEVWIQFADKADYDSKEKKLDSFFSEDGAEVCVYLVSEKAVKRIPKMKRINPKKLEKVREWIGESNVKIVTKEKNLEDMRNFYTYDRIEVSLERIANTLENLNECICDLISIREQ